MVPLSSQCSHNKRACGTCLQLISQFIHSWSKAENESLGNLIYLRSCTWLFLTCSCLILVIFSICPSKHWDPLITMYSVYFCAFNATLYFNESPLKKVNFIFSKQSVSTELLNSKFKILIITLEDVAINQLHAVFLVLFHSLNDRLQQLQHGIW